MTRSDWNLLVLAAASGERLQPVHLQKILFLLGENCPRTTGSSYYRFAPYHYGAFDADVYRDAERLESQGLALMWRVPGGWKEYAVSPAGLTRARELEARLSPAVRRYVQQLVNWARGLSFGDLVSAVYKAYPWTKANSIFRK
ncbi:MAG TPA: hypothetical protein VKE94_13020 [Gemmataceae bacterium]|nr:hypothetical protein [Gemmataceae bacterium]